MKMRNNKFFKTSILCVALVGVASCGKQDNSTASVPPAPAVAGANAQQQTNIKIIAYGPEGTETGKSFNVQSSGESALWVKLDHPAVGSEAAIWWGNQRLDSSVSEDTITALVPAKLYTNAGKYSLQVRAHDGNSHEKESNVVYFTVK